eukprot:1120811-Prorocentrum_lima.AAC.1
MALKKASADTVSHMKTKVAEAERQRTRNATAAQQAHLLNIRIEAKAAADRRREARKSQPSREVVPVF